MSNRRSKRRAKPNAADRVSAPEEIGFAEPQEADGGRPAWVERLWSVLKVGFGAILVIAVSGAVAWGGHRYALTTPRFAIQEVVVDGNRRLASAAVQEAAGIALGKNIFALDVEAAEKAILDNSWVAEARVVRRLPGTVRIELLEREAGAVVVVGGRLMLATRTGELFRELGPEDPFDLPVVTGISVEALARDRDRELERVAEALDLLRQYDRLPLSPVFPAQEVHLDGSGSATLTVGSEGLTLELGQPPFKRKLLRAVRVVERAQAKGKAPGVVFLDNDSHPERVVVRMR